MIRITLKVRQSAGQFIVFSTLMGLPAFAQQPFVPAPHRPVPLEVPPPVKHIIPAAPRSMVGGYWRTDANYKSALHLKNALANAPLTVTPVLYLSTGANYTLPDVTLEPSGIALVDINAALQQQGIAPWATLGGYVEVKFVWGWDALCATVHNVDPVHSEIFNFNLRPSAPHGVQDAVPVEGLWWKQEPNVAGFLALTNLSSNSQNASVVVSDKANTPLGLHTVTVQPHGTKLVDMAEVRSSASQAGGIRITLDGLQGDWVVNGWLEDPATGYSANIPVSTAMFSSLAQKPSPNIAELGLMTGAASPMLAFPSGTVFTPYSVLRNISDQAVSVTPTFWWMEGASPRSAVLAPVTVPPMQTQGLDVPSLLSGAGLPNFSGSLNLVLDVSGPLSAVLFAAGSVDQKNTYVFQVSPFAVSAGAGRSISYWSTGNGDDTMVTLWNPADEAQDLLFTLMFSGGHYAYPVHLDPRATRMFNISEVIRSQVPDAQGNVAPLSVHEGSATLTGAKSKAEHILVSMEVGTYNVQKATCGTDCATCAGAVGGWIDQTQPSVAVGASTQLTFTVEWYDGATYSYLADSGSWSSSDTNIATVDGGGSVTGVNPGSVEIVVNDSGMPNYSDGQSCPPLGCMYGVGGATTANVTPTVTNISPAMVVAGTSSAVTISGSGLSNSPAVSVSGGISATVNSASNTQIVATLNVPTTAGGNQNLTVKVNGIASQISVIFIQIPTYFKGNDHFPASACTGNNPSGVQTSVFYQVYDQTGNNPVSVGGMTPLENAPGTNGLFAPFATPPTTGPDGKFTDTPVGTCFTTTPPNPPPPQQICFNVQQQFEIRVGGVGSGIFPIATVTNRTDCGYPAGQSLTANPPMFTFTIN